MDHPLQAVIAWVRKGYPHGVPTSDYVPLFALLRRQLSHDEVLEVAAGLAATSPLPVSRIDAGVQISKITDELPHEHDVARVRDTLEAAGWPFDDEPLRGDPNDEPPADPPTDPEATP